MVDSPNNPTMLHIRIKASKTDPVRVGVDIFVGRSGCPAVPGDSSTGLPGSKRSQTRPTLSIPGWETSDKGKVCGASAGHPDQNGS